MKAPCLLSTALLILSACSRTSRLEIAPPKPLIGAPASQATEGSPTAAGEESQEVLDTSFAGAEGEEKIPNVKYASAAVFEGGTGSQWSEDPNSQPQPKWRVTLCLEKTSEEKSGHVEFDLASLGTVYMTPAGVEAKKKGAAYHTLDQVAFDYKYTTRIQQYQGEQAWGEVTLKTENPQQTWTLHPATSDTASTAPAQPAELSLFKMDWSFGTLAGDADLAFKPEDKAFYLSRRLLQYEYNALDTSVANPVAICEERDQPVLYEVLQ